MYYYLTLTEWLHNETLICAGMGTCTNGLFIIAEMDCKELILLK